MLINLIQCQKTKSELEAKHYIYQLIQPKQNKNDIVDIACRNVVDGYFPELFQPIESYSGNE